jgi:hypothetical protein
MKKNKLLISTLLLGVLCGMTTVACNVTPATSTATPTTAAPEKVANRVVISQPKGDVMVGQTINLDDYVEVIGENLDSDNDFSAKVLTEETATLDGHNLTIIKEGEVSVEITANTVNAKKGKFTIQALSTLKAAFKDKTQFTTNYFVEDIIVEQNAAGGYDMYLSGNGIVHNSKYFAYPETDKNGNVTGYNGILEAKSGKTYEFACADLAGKNLEVLPGPQVPIGQYYLTQPFSLNYMDFETLYDEKTGEAVALVCTDNTAISNYCMQTCGVYPPSDYASILYKKYKDQLGLSNVKLAAQELVAEFLYTDEEATMENAILSIMVIGTYDFTYNTGKTEQEQVLFSYAALSADPAKYTMKGVEDYISSGAEPAALKCDSLIEKLSQAATLRNYTQQTSYFWSTEVGNQNKPTEDIGWGLPNATFVQAVTENTIFTQEQISETETAQHFYTVQDDQVYFGSNYDYDDEGNVVIQSGFSLEPIQNVSSIWDDPVYSSLTLNAFKDGSIFDSVTVSGVQEVEGATWFDLGNCPEFAQTMVALGAGYGSSINGFFTQNEMYKYVQAEAIVTDTAVQVTVYLPVQMEDNSVRYYNIVSTFVQIGATTAPDLSPLFK